MFLFFQQVLDLSMGDIYILNVNDYIVSAFKLEKK